MSFPAAGEPAKEGGGGVMKVGLVEEGEVGRNREKRCDGGSENWDVRFGVGGGSVVGDGGDDAR